MGSPKTTKPPSPPLDSGDAEVLLKANYRNLARKVQAGKTLSVSEVNLLEAIKSGGEVEARTHAIDQSELARILGISRKTIQRAMKAEGCPGAKPDGRYEIASWRAWFAARGTLDDGDASLSQTQLKARQILLQNQKLEYQLAVLRRDYVPAGEVEKWGGELGAAVRKVVSQIHLVAPNVVGVSIPEAEARLKDVEDEILQQLHLVPQKLSDWKHEPGQ